MFKYYSGPSVLAFGLVKRRIYHQCQPIQTQIDDWVAVSTLLCEISRKALYLNIFADGVLWSDFHEEDHIMHPRTASQSLGIPEVRGKEYTRAQHSIFYWPSRSARLFAKQQRLKAKEQELRKREATLVMREKQVATALELFRSARNLPA